MPQMSDSSTSPHSEFASGVMAVAGDGGDAQRGADALGLDVAFAVAPFGELVKPQRFFIEAEVLRQDVRGPFLSQTFKLTAPVFH